MPSRTVISVKDFNPDKLREELDTAALMALITSIGWAGFDQVTDRRYTPAPARRVIGRSVSSGVTTTDEADPGELRFALTRDLTASEIVTLDATLADHLYTLLSAEQVRQDLDESDRDSLAADFTNWALLTALQKDAAHKRLVRLELRRERGAAI